MLLMMAIRLNKAMGFALSLLAMWYPFSGSAQTCPQLEHQVVIYFGNGINTSPISAESSLRRLRNNLGDVYNNKKLRYDIAYNATDGMAEDLLQAAHQAGVQWDSELASWLERLDLAPEWFISWYQRGIEARTFAYTPELDQHLESYRSDILLGQRVLIVAHSQGNFYANLIKPILAGRLNTDQMRRRPSQ